MRTGVITPAVHDLLSSRLYGRLRNFTESCLTARGLYHRWGTAPRPEDPDSIKCIIGAYVPVVKPGFGTAQDHGRPLPFRAS